MCASITLCGLDACALNKSDVNSLDIQQCCTAVLGTTWIRFRNDLMTKFGRRSKNVT